VRASVRAFRFLVTALATVALTVFPASSSAHPMGNFSISHYAGVRIERGFVELQYLIDMAEIPTFQELQQNNIVAQADDPRLQSYLTGQAEAFRKVLVLTLNGEPLPLVTISKNVLFTPGAGNLPTMKFGFVYHAQVTDSCAVRRCELEYQDANFSGRLGWKEIIASAGHGVAIENSSALSRDRSNQLSNYPTDLINSPPQDVAAKILYSIQTTRDVLPSHAMTHAKTDAAPTITKPSWAAKIAENVRPTTASAVSTSSPVAAAAIQLKPNQQATPRNPFTEMITTKQIGFAMALLAAAIAAGLGALHALEPGHGKTIVAAYLVGSRGTARHALLLGMIVTISHTAGVYLLGAITLYAQHYVLPERIYPFLAVLSGILITGMGGYLFLQRFMGVEFAHKHSYEMSVTEQGRNEGPQHRPANISGRQLLLLGITGGIVPCPAALVVLLSATALHRTGFGLYLIVAFSLGLAGVLIAMGLAAVYAGNLLCRWRLEAPLIQRWLPMASAAMIVLLGFGVTIRGLMSAGIVQIPMWS